MIFFIIILACFPCFLLRDFYIGDYAVDITKGIYPCTLFLNHTSRIGCSSDFKTSYGKLYLISSENDLIFLSFKRISGPLVLAFAPAQFTKLNLEKAESYINIAGVIVLQSSSLFKTSPVFSSLESDCFNSRFDYYSKIDGYQNCSKIKWNPFNENLIERLYPYPMALISDETMIKTILNCNSEHIGLEDNFKNYPFCGIQFDHFMYSKGMTTPICMSKNKFDSFVDQSFCDPLVADNIYATIFPSSAFKTAPDYIIVAVKLDTRSLFIGSAVGAESELTGLVVALSMLSTMAAFRQKTIEFTGDRKNILFIFFDGEPWDNIGSSRVAYDLRENKFKAIDGLNAEKISAYFELDQLGLLSDDKYWIHTDPILMNNSAFNSKVQNYIDIVAKQSQDQNLKISVVNVQNPEQPLPPCSYQQFLRHSLKIPGFVIAGYKSTFENKFYHGNFDNSKNLNIDFDELGPKPSLIIDNLAKLSFTLTKSILLLSGVSPSSLNQVDSPSLVINQLIFCLVEKTNCSLFRASLSPENQKNALSNSTFTRDATFSTAFSSTILAYIGYSLGNKFPSNSEGCKLAKDSSLLNFMAETECVINATVYRHTVHSPYFDNPKNPLTNYSSWTTSTYASTKTRLYLIESVSTARNTMILGAILTFLTIIISVALKLKGSLYIGEI